MFRKWAFAYLFPNLFGYILFSQLFGSIGYRIGIPGSGGATHYNFELSNNQVVLWDANENNYKTEEY